MSSAWYNEEAEKSSVLHTEMLRKYTPMPRIIETQESFLEENLPPAIWSNYMKLINYLDNPWRIELEDINYTSEKTYPTIIIKIKGTDRVEIEKITFPIPLLLVSIRLQYKGCYHLYEEIRSFWVEGDDDREGEIGISSLEPIYSKAVAEDDVWTPWMIKNSRRVVEKWREYKLPFLIPIIKIPPYNDQYYHGFGKKPYVVINEKSLRVSSEYKNINSSPIKSDVPTPWNTSDDNKKVRVLKRTRRE